MKEFTTQQLKDALADTMNQYEYITDEIKRLTVIRKKLAHQIIELQTELDKRDETT